MENLRRGWLIDSVVIFLVLVFTRMGVVEGVITSPSPPSTPPSPTVPSPFVVAGEGFAIGVGERRTTGVYVADFTGLLNTVSNAATATNTGNAIMANGDTAVVAVGSYTCSDETCAISHSMLLTEDLHGEVRCVEDNASCVIDGETSRRGMGVSGTGSGKLILRALSYISGEASFGGGVFIAGGAIVDIELCVFSDCRSTMSSLGGGAIIVFDGGTTVDVQGTSFNGNTADSRNGHDIYRSAGIITLYDTCPSPYSSNTPIQGKMRIRIV